MYWCHCKDNLKLSAHSLAHTHTHTHTHHTHTHTDTHTHTHTECRAATHRYSREDANHPVLSACQERSFAAEWFRQTVGATQSHCYTNTMMHTCFCNPRGRIANVFRHGCWDRLLTWRNILRSYRCHNWIISTIAALTRLWPCWIEWTTDNAGTVGYLKIVFTQVYVLVCVCLHIIHRYWISEVWCHKWYQCFTGWKWFLHCNLMHIFLKFNMTNSSVV